MEKDVTAIISSCKFGDLTVIQANKLINEAFAADLIIRVPNGSETSAAMSKAIDTCNSNRRFRGDQENKITMEIIFDGTAIPGQTLDLIQVIGLKDHKELFSLACIYSDYYREFSEKK